MKQIITIALLLGTMSVPTMAVQGTSSGSLGVGAGVGVQTEAQKQQATDAKARRAQAKIKADAAAAASTSRTRGSSTEGADSATTTGAMGAVDTQGSSSSSTTNNGSSQGTYGQQSAADLRLGVSVQQELRRRFKGFNPNRQIVFTKNGQVTLSGSVDTRAEAEEMERSVRRLRGVSRVNNNLVIDVSASGSSSSTTDSENQ